MTLIWTAFYLQSPYADRFYCIVLEEKCFQRLVNESVKHFCFFFPRSLRARRDDRPDPVTGQLIATTTCPRHARHNQKKFIVTLYMLCSIKISERECGNLDDTLDHRSLSERLCFERLSSAVLEAGTLFLEFFGERRQISRQPFTL